MTPSLPTTNVVGRPGLRSRGPGPRGVEHAGIGDVELVHEGPGRGSVVPEVDPQEPDPSAPVGLPHRERTAPRPFCLDFALIFALAMGALRAVSGHACSSWSVEDTEGPVSPRVSRARTGQEKRGGLSRKTGSRSGRKWAERRYREIVARGAARDRRKRTTRHIPHPLAPVVRSHSGHGTMAAAIPSAGRTSSTTSTTCKTIRVFRTALLLYRSRGRRRQSQRAVPDTLEGNHLAHKR